MPIGFIDRLKSNNPSGYGIVAANEISGHRRVKSLQELYKLPDAILSLSGSNTDNDAIGQLWYVSEERVFYQLKNWANRGNLSGWSVFQAGGGVVSIAYSDLVGLRDGSSLSPGTFYRITDYEFTTKQANTRSAGHVFDILVLALGADILSHNAYAVHHDGDSYFEGVELGAWQLWYDLDNDTTKYQWADAENGKGVIYRMIDEKRNDCPYDFKNALFSHGGRYCYTFSTLVGGVISDVSGTNRCHSNYIARFTELPNIVFVGKTASPYFVNNSFGPNCYNNTFGDGCYQNSFGPNCYNNTFGDGCSNNTFGQGCYGNRVGNSSTSNTFGNVSSINSVGDYCIGNTFGETFGYNILENYCSGNTFMGNCGYNILRENSSLNVVAKGTRGKTLQGSNTNVSELTIVMGEQYYDDGSGKLVPAKHPDLSTQASILPYKFMGNYVYEQLMPAEIVVFNSGEVEVRTKFSQFGLDINSIAIIESAIIVFHKHLNGEKCFRSSFFSSPSPQSNTADAFAWKWQGVNNVVYSVDYNTIQAYLKLVYTSMPDDGTIYYYDNCLPSGSTTDGTLWTYDVATDTLILANEGEVTPSSIPSDYAESSNIVLSEGVTSIGAELCYRRENLKTVTIPSSVSSIDERAFAYCISLESIICRASSPPSLLGSYIFYQINPTKLVISVPSDSVSVYRNTPEWMNFNIVSL